MKPSLTSPLGIFLLSLTSLVLTVLLGAGSGRVGADVVLYHCVHNWYFARGLVFYSGLYFVFTFITVACRLQYQVRALKMISSFVIWSSVPLQLIWLLVIYLGMSMASGKISV